MTAAEAGRYRSWTQEEEDQNWLIETVARTEDRTLTPSSHMKLPRPLWPLVRILSTSASLCFHVVFFLFFFSLGIGYVVKRSQTDGKCLFIHFHVQRVLSTLTGLKSLIVAKAECLCRNESLDVLTNATMLSQPGSKLDKGGKTTHE